MVGYGLGLGYRRGPIIVALEFGQALVSLLIAAILFHPVGNIWRGAIGGNASLAHVSAFIAIYLAAEMAIMIASMTLIRRHARRLIAAKISPVSCVLGAVMGGLKLAAYAAAIVILIEALPLSGSDQRVLFASPITKFALSQADPVAKLLHSLLGSDLRHGLGLLTVATDPEDDKVVPLNFTTTGQPDLVGEHDMLASVNTERSRQSLEPLKTNHESQTVARLYALELLAGGYFSHQGRDGSSPFDRLTRGKVPFGYAGENLALAPDVRAAHQGLINSPPHRANILSSHYRTVGIGIIKTPDHGVMVVQEFTD